MSFLNQYSNSDIQIKSAKEFLENGILYDYAVGKSSEGACIMKTTTDGELVWKKEYRIDGWGFESTFHEIIQSKLNNGEIVYFLYATNNDDHFIISINSSGNYIKIKQLKLFSTFGVFLVESKISTNFYLTFSGLYEGDEQTYGGNTLRQLMVLEFNNEIDIINKKYYSTGSASDILLNSVKSYLDGLLIIFDHKAGITHLLDLKYDLSVRIHKEIFVGDGNYSNFFSHDLIIVANNVSDPKKSKYIVSGNSSEGNILLVSLDGNQQSYVYEVPQSLGLHSNMVLDTNELYLNLFQPNTDKQGSVIHKININSFSNFIILWSKAFKLGQLFYGIKKLIKSNFNSIFIYSSYDESLLLDSLVDLNTCITILLDYTMPPPSPFNVINRETGIDEISYGCTSIENITVVERPLRPENICEFILDPNPEEQCIKDETICELYNQLLDLQIKCLHDPKNDIEDNKSFVSCFKNGLELFYNFVKQNSKEEWITILEQYLSIINTYINNPTSENYLNAYQAFNSILNFISQQGNCNCENVLDISDYSSIQSGHLYLQSAGSLGEDSTKGIHLRWALKEALANHLPKANYATTTHNFNKTDDFVKIYRAKYVPFKTTLDFNNIPLQINESGSQRNWIYEVNGKVFHVHFRNIIKYNQVRATINPANNPLIFIKNYGDAILEIETKTALSFKISLTFEILSSENYVKTELLSVPENKITAPKGASLRKKYTAEELNEKPLLSENIRSIRFSSSNSHISIVSFEFYSDFIINTKKENKWNFLGKYALTKETNIAFQRLEPATNCLESWLRYNDQAFVNVTNYHTRWNSSDIPEFERIYTSVEKYIDLSDAFNNPSAIEIFPFENNNNVAACNLTYPNNDPDNPEYDPYIPENPNETTGIKIPFLEVLQLGSLDYHVARMLGLGILDLNPLVFDGEYMYLSEYITFGDLHDGLGARQVQHLYCSLPTSLNDQRLPIPVDLKEPVPGAFFNNGYDGSEVDDEEEIIDTEQNNFAAVELTDDGYSPDGKTKYYSLFPEYTIDEIANAPFYYISNEFIASENTDPVFAGLEYRKTGETNWIKPELSYNTEYFNIDTSGVSVDLTNETVEIAIPDQGKPMFTHAIKESCRIDYSSYGINWFSRAARSEFVHPVEIILRPKNELLPPSNLTATLIQKELPLLLTTSEEQFLYTGNTNLDKTLVRLTFEYNHAQELIDYHQKINGETILNYYEVPNSKELFAEKVQIFFRDQVPNSVSGKVSMLQDNSNPLLIEVVTSEYIFASNGDIAVPSIPIGSENNYIGSIMLVDNVEYIVHEVDNTGSNPKFIIFKSDASGALLNLNGLSNLEAEIFVPEIGSLFVIVENMQNLSLWGIPNNVGFSVNIDHNIVHREDEIIIKNIDCNTETHVQKFRGIYRNATIEKVLEKVDEDGDGEYDIDGNGGYIYKHLGLYKITFPEFQFQQHSQYFVESDPGANSVEWYNGVVRLHTLSDINEPRKEFKVIRTENIGSTTSDLILYIEDLTFPTESLPLSTYKGKLMADEDDSINQMVNYYPGYKVYLYKDDNLGLNKNTVLPQGEDEVRYTVFGLRSWDFPDEFEYDNTEDFFSKMSIPALMFANAVIEPVRPQRPSGGNYATRPDYFGKASYTFNTKYGTPEEIHKPYSVQFNRASDIQFLSAIYDNSVFGYDVNEEPILNTVQQVMRNIFLNGEEDFFVDRWDNLLSFNYNYNGIIPNNPLFPDEDGYFKYFDGRRLPMPNNSSFIDSINAFIDEHNEFYGTIVPHLLEEFNLNTVVIPVGLQNSELKFKDFLKDVLHNCFVPLTEMPVLYNFVKPSPYKPIPKKQVIRDRNRNLLKPTLDPESEFDMAPMVSRIDPPGQQYESQFTDFGLDGASNAKYFYAVREINNQLKTSDYSEILGPISLVNTAPPIAPEIIKVIPLLENRVLGIAPAFQLQINAYPKAQNIAKVSIYRADNPSDALSIRTMKLVKVLDLEVENLIDESKWIFEDDFYDLIEVPFADPLFYRLTVSRKIRYNDKELANIVDYTPSEASKLIITNIVENYSPVSPSLNYYSEPLNSNNELTTIVLHWEKTCYKGKYYLYKMNSQGNWVKIHELQTNDQDIYLPLELTALESGTLSTLNNEGNLIYHHFKVISENTAGMTSKDEHILTVHNEANWQDIGGIGDMIIRGTFYIR